MQRSRGNKPTVSAAAIAAVVKANLHLCVALIEERRHEAIAALKPEIQKPPERHQRSGCPHHTEQSRCVALAEGATTPTEAFRTHSVYPLK